MVILIKANMFSLFGRVKKNDVWYMVLKNAAIVVWPLLACTNRDSGGSSVSACPVYLFLRSREPLKVGVLYLPCAVAYNPIGNTGTLLGLFLVSSSSSCKQRKKNTHTEQIGEIKHGTSSLVICTPYQVNTRAGLLARSMWRQLLTAHSFRGQHACFAN